ncbi:hypothetical protein J2Z44_003931 [Clostridium punense]|uniref:Uncharacterized protein n=1 Tax=Clostridium punense TaxID=1054297 RepID=A0ABS4K9Y1_9CLOT|nr:MULTISPECIES: hypothetical protein [Clostridium]EQB89225.1 hypothetical protein M918_21360 [Clostridium sp. BL8]MBP2024081.1 hypothetical protein [Clostridium punense]
MKNDNPNYRQETYKNKKEPRNDFNEREEISTLENILDEGEFLNISSNIPAKSEIQSLINSLNNLNISSLNGDKDLYTDINSKLDSINNILAKTSDNSTIGSDTTALEDLKGILEYITTINALKNQLNELPFNTFEKIYVENCITPTLTVFYQLCIAAASFKDTAQSLSLSTTTKRKTHKIKDYEKTTYEIMNQIQCLYDILEHRIYDFIKVLCKCK